MTSEIDGSLLHKESKKRKQPWFYEIKPAKNDALQAVDDKVSQLKSLPA